MPPKRKNDQASEEPTGREKKKQKMAAARTIAVQSPQQSLASAGSNVTIDSMKGLPSAIDVEKFAEARAFEINAMQDAMKNASASSTQRAWQTLPRHLRRRAASHNVRRVPLRLREKARAEMDPVRRKALGRSMPKRGKANRISRSESLLKRQRDKTWLETHIWHAKRMHMANIWGYRLAMHPTEKSFRPSHRASVHGSILHDASYYGLIQLKGPEKILSSLLEFCCDPQGHGPGAKRFLTGARVLETHIYKPGSYPFDLIAPITVFWSPTFTAPTSSTTTQPSIERTENDKDPDDVGSRTVWVRVHPSVFSDAFAALKASASSTLDVLRLSLANNGQKGDVEIEISDLRGQVNVFEIMGPKASQVIKGSLMPVGDDRREDMKKFWLSLANLQTAGAVPRGMVIGFKVQDPRLKFPPKNAKSKREDGHRLSPALAVFPTSTLAQSEIWDQRSRDKLKRPRYKKKDIDERRSKNLVPGTTLSPLRQDDRVPLLLIQRSLEPTSSTLTPTPSSTQSIHGYTLLLPSGWSMPFLSSLTHTGTRVGGQRERQNQSFEAGVPYFPRDYPFTTAYEAEEQARVMEEKGKWERKPKAKRCNWDKVGTRSPWRADWEVILGLEEPEEVGDLVTTQREPDSPTKKTIRPWLLRGAETSSIINSASKVLNAPIALHSSINRLRLKRFQDPLPSEVSPEHLWMGALVRVGVKMCRRGCPGDLAAIYRVDDDEGRALRWSRVNDEEKDEAEASTTIPPQDSIIGYITTGNFSLSRGSGFSIGAIPISRLFELQDQAQRLKTTSLFVKIRDREGTICRTAHLQVIDG